MVIVLHAHRLQHFGAILVEGAQAGATTEIGVYFEFADIFALLLALFGAAHTPALRLLAEGAGAPFSRAVRLFHQLFGGDVIVFGRGGFVMTALTAKGTVLRAIARAHVGDGADFHLVAAEGLAQAVGAGH